MLNAGQFLRVLVCRGACGECSDWDFVRFVQSVNKIMPVTHALKELILEWNGVPGRVWHLLVIVSQECPVCREGLSVISQNLCSHEASHSHTGQRRISGISASLFVFRNKGLLELTNPRQSPGSCNIHGTRGTRVLDVFLT